MSTAMWWRCTTEGDVHVDRSRYEAMLPRVDARKHTSIAPTACHFAPGSDCLGRPWLVGWSQFALPVRTPKICCFAVSWLLASRRSGVKDRVWCQDAKPTQMVIYQTSWRSEQPSTRLADQMVRFVVLAALQVLDSSMKSPRPYEATFDHGARSILP